MSAEALHSSRPRSGFLLGSAALALVGVLGSAGWALADVGALVRPQAQTNLARFGAEAVPPTLRGQGFDLLGWGTWVGQQLAHGGAEAVLGTLALSLASIGLAAFLATPLAVLAARTLARRDPFATGPPSGPRAALGAVLRVVLVLLRAVPEYVLAFLLLALMGPGAWAAILALALHNAGILGRLWAESIEALPAGPGRALWRIGARRSGLAALTVGPMVAGRGTLYLFTRWESAVRESTVLGLLGFTGLGWWVQDARARLHYDELLLAVVLAGLLVWVGDGLGVLVGRWVREGEGPGRR